MKKLLSLLMAMVMLCALLPAAVAEEAYHYTSAQYNVGPFGENLEVVEWVNEKYGIDYELYYVEETNRATQLGLLAASGELPDIIYGADTQLFYEQGLIGTWTEEFFREHAPRISAMIDQYAPNAWGAVKYDGEMYTVPGVRYVNTIPNVWAWNQNWLDNLGVTEVPTALEDVEALLYRIAKEDPDGNGADDTYGLSASGLQAVYGAFGFNRDQWMLDDEGKVIFSDVYPKAKDALALLAKWYADGVLDPEFITGENQGGSWSLTHAFINQRIGATSHGSFYHWSDLRKLTDLNIANHTLGTVAKAIADSDNPFEVTIAHPPVGPDGKSGTTRAAALVTRNCFSTELVEDTERFGRLLEVIDDLMMDMDNCFTIMHGIQDKHWEYTEIAGIKTIAMKGEYASWAAADKGQIGADGWFNFNNFGYEIQKATNAYNTVFWQTYMNDWVDKGYETLFTNTLPSASLYEAETDKILAEGYIAIITGEKPIEYFDEMVKAWYAAGGQVLTEEAAAIYAAQ